MQNQLANTEKILSVCKAHHEFVCCSPNIHFGFHGILFTVLFRYDEVGWMETSLFPTKMGTPTSPLVSKHPVKKLMKNEVQSKSLQTATPHVLVPHPKADMARWRGILNSIPTFQRPVFMGSSGFAITTYFIIFLSLPMWSTSVARRVSSAVLSKSRSPWFWSAQLDAFASRCNWSSVMSTPDSESLVDSWLIN